MLFDIGEQVYLNGEIRTNRYPRGDIGVNDIKTIFVNNLKGTIYEIELPNFLNGGQFLYTIKIFENLYGIEVKQKQISNYQIASNGVYTYTPPTNVYGINVGNLNTKDNSYVKLNSLSTLEQLNQLNKLNFINNQIQQSNRLNQNLNTSKQVQKTISKYIYYKLVDEWLYTKLFPLLAFVKLVDSKPQLIKSISEYNISKLSTQTDEEIEMRAEYLEKNIITKKLVFKILKKIIKRMCLNWYELDKHEKTIQNIFMEYFKDLIEESIKRL